MNCIVTGGAGFIGSHVVQHLHRKTNWNLIVIDKLSYASQGFNRLKDMEVFYSPRVTTFTWDLSIPMEEGLLQEINYKNVDYIIHIGAESHVDKSISNPVPFVKNNINSTLELLELARKMPRLKKFIMFSTDEVYGPSYTTEGFKENDPHTPTNPYSASKSMCEQLCIAYENTYKVPIIITNMVNAFGEYQDTEKFIPKVIRAILKNEKIYIHTYPKSELPGSRFYIHSRNVADAVLYVLEHGVVRERYNITSDTEVDNLELVDQIATIMQLPYQYELVDNLNERPGHDPRYNLNGTKLTQLGWKCKVSFDESLYRTVEWYMRNLKWLN